MNRIKSFLKGVSTELKKVTWPSEKDMKTYVAQVLVFGAMLTAFFFVVDLVISQVMDLLG